MNVDSLSQSTGQQNTYIIYTVNTRLGLHTVIAIASKTAVSMNICEGNKL